MNWRYYLSMSVDNEVQKAAWLEYLSWVEADALLQQDRVIVLPLGAAAKEHGPHLPLNNDSLIAAWLAREVAKRSAVVIAPTVNVSFYPAFVDYPGSITLRAETARDMLADICTSLAAHGGSRFYVLNTGVSTEGPLEDTQRVLATKDVRFEFLRLGKVLERLPDGLLEQSWGSHADEHETSLMLHIAPEVVDMDKALDDGNEGEGRLSRVAGDGIHSASGIYGQATLATAEKGKVIAAALLDQALEDIEILLEGNRF